MNFTPKRKNGNMRALYLGLLGLGLILMVLNPENNSRRTAFVLVSLVSLTVGIYLMVRYELTTYTYILNAKEDDFDFFVDKSTGKRGNYVCYYKISDVASYLPYEKDTKDELVKKYINISFYTYTNNPSCKTNVLVFGNRGHYDAIIMERDEAYDEYIRNAIRLAKEKQAEKSDDEEDIKDIDINENDTNE